MKHTRHVRLIRWVVCLLVPQVINVVLGPLLLPSDSTAHLVVLCVLLFLASLLLVLAIEWHETRPPIREFFNGVKRMWEQEYRNAELARVDNRIEYLYATEDTATEAVATEGVVERYRSRRMVVATATRQERAELFNRFSRPYHDLLSSFRNRNYGTASTVPIPVIGLNGVSLDHSLKQKIAGLLGTSADPQGVDSIVELCLVGRLSLLLLVDATGLSAYDAVDWILSCPLWIPHVVFAVRPDMEFALLETRDPSLLFLSVPRHHPGQNRAIHIREMIEARVAAIEHETGISAAECRRTFRRLATMFLEHEMDKKSGPWLSDAVVSALGDIALRIAACLSDWISSRLRGGSTWFSWKQEARSCRDYLVACAIHTGEYANAEFARDANDSIMCPYVRPYLGVLAVHDDDTTHPLSAYPLSPAHLVIAACWEETAEVTPEVLEAVSRVMAQDPLPVLDWRDLASLLPRCLRSGVPIRYMSLFRSIPGQLTALRILRSGATGEAMLDALDELVSAADLWECFERHYVLSERAVTALSNTGDSLRLHRLCMAMALAPHGAPLPDMMVDMLRLAVESGRGVWDMVQQAPVSEMESEVLAVRLGDIAKRMGSSGRLWLKSGRMSPAASKIHGCIVEAENALRV